MEIKEDRVKDFSEYAEPHFGTDIAKEILKEIFVDYNDGKKTTEEEYIIFQNEYYTDVKRQFRQYLEEEGLEEKFQSPHIEEIFVSRASYLHSIKDFSKSDAIQQAINDYESFCSSMTSEFTQ